MKPPVFSCLNSHVLNNGSLYGRFLFGPLPIDISLTIATILRRSLLHTQPNLYIISAEIDGATHEYASLPGIQESVLEILLNLGEIVLAHKNQNLVSCTKELPSSNSFFGNKVQPDQSPLTALLHISGPCVVKAKDISWPEGVWCVKPNMPIATLSNNQTLAMRLKIVPIFKQNPSNFFGVAENSESFNISPRELGPFRTESLNREFKTKDSTWTSLVEAPGETKPKTSKSTALGSFGVSTTLGQKTKTHEPCSAQALSLLSPDHNPVKNPVVPGVSFSEAGPAPRNSENKKELNDCVTSQEGGPISQSKPSSWLGPSDYRNQNQTLNPQTSQKFWPSKSLWGPFKASNVLIKSDDIDSSLTSIKKAGELTTKATTNTMLLEDSEQQSATKRRLLFKWNQEGFLLKQSKEIETLTNNKEYVSSSQTTLPRQLKFSQTNSTQFNATSISESNGSSFEQKNFDNKILGQELKSKFTTHGKENNNPVKGIELAVSPSTYPVEKVNFLIERDDQLAGYRHRIIFEVWTNGSISPRQAIFDSIGWILKLLYNFRQPVI